MITLFSSFDSYFWSYSLIPLGIFVVSIISRINKITFLSVCTRIFTGNVQKFLSTLKPKGLGKLFFLLPISIFLFMYFVNSISILPYNFALTSQLRFVLSLRLIFWGSFVIFYAIRNTAGFLRHCIPEGTPLPLTWFLFFIELVRNLIRPVTLTVRMLANIVAGHLLINLLSQVALNFKAAILVYALLNLVETAVALIQAYIYITLISLYYSDLR